jgi:ferredoxin
LGVPGHPELKIGKIVAGAVIMMARAMPTPQFPTAPVHAARLAPGGERFDAPADMPLLLAAEAAGLALPSSCRNGTCRTCLCQMTQGQVAYRIEWPGLSAEEKAGGFILPCVAYPVADVVLRAEPARWL